MADKIPGFYVPTLDIDLIWHTHMLFPKNYQQFGLKRTGRVIHHDDSIVQTVLDNSFQKTSKKWFRLYKERYALSCDSRSAFSKGAGMYFCFG
jgi:hypothetical protein